ncbi:zf-HC2 domain-containing protein [Pseudodesulfovibrio mercurii]|nr:zf-HC2 domain-containing protein [Pseudodesulfovibrio mercurii]
MAHHLSDEQLAELGLAATEGTGHPGPCPSAEDLAALREGRLDAARRAEILAHLDGCAECVARWLAVSSVDASSEDAPERAVPAPRAVSPVFVRTVAVIAAVAACVFFVIRLFPPSGGGPDFARSVDAGYRLVLDDPRLYAALSGPVRELAASGGVRSAGTPAEGAFEAGWAAGLAALGRGREGVAAPSGNARAEYVFAAGRWSVLVHAALDAEVPSGGNFWKEQARTAGLFQERTAALAPGDETRHRALWGDLAAVLDRLADGSATARDRDRLCRLLGGLGRVMGESDLGA